MQLDLFYDINISTLKEEVIKLRQSNEQVRKGLFARHSSLEKYLTELRDQISEQQREIYKLKSKIYEDVIHPPILYIKDG